MHSNEHYRGLSQYFGNKGKDIVLPRALPMFFVTGERDIELQTFLAMVLGTGEKDIFSIFGIKLIMEHVLLVKAS